MYESQLGELGFVLLSGGREKIRGELACLGHVTSDLHLALHESNLRVQLTEAYLLEIIISHGESGVSLSGLAFFAESLSVFKVNLVD